MITFAWPWVFLLLPLPLLARWFLPPAEPQVGKALHLPFYARLPTSAGGAVGVCLSIHPSSALPVQSFHIAPRPCPEMMGLPRDRLTLHLTDEGLILLSQIFFD